MIKQQRVDLIIKEVTQRLELSGSESPALDAAVLLCHVLDKPRSFVYTWPDKTLCEEQIIALDIQVARREKGEPIAYITGEREFWSLPLKVSPTTLIPRPDTERLVELALDKAPETSGDILDLGTGTGAIALALATELPDRKVLGVDLKPEAQALASENASRLGISNARFLSGSWFEPITDGTKFALIVSNPPYIDANDPHLEAGDVRFEPSSALVAKDNGLADIRTITEQAKRFLKQSGWLLFEHGFEQGSDVRAILLEQGYERVSTEKDYGGNDRVTMGRFSQQ
ncbi:peptide chain release factor N(5)-glutamine methyltransferase [Vibrio sonorensis]|uniref:peptide chain release factor N(5)-glutamine methyltransferase n=1 Tax=Vibrio sonorensis TaxID=1004316 RepID=UPI0008D8F6A6|nr:peptide chain release factor N(5)-glutamine methyltransferase [Vibrio sonorensis]